MRFELDCAADRDGRLEGTLGWEGSGPVQFSGTLELLRLLEDHAPRQSAGRDHAIPDTGGSHDSNG
jgi:hypothetical protein